MATTPKKATVKPIPQYGRKLTIGFGLVNVPVKLKPLVETRRPVPGKGMCAEHGPNLVQVSVCSRGTEDEHVVENAEKLTGYPHPDNPEQLVVLDAEVVKAMSEASDNVGSVEKFVDAGEITSTYLDKPFLVWPDTGGEQAFDLLAALLQSDGRAAIVNVVMQKQTETLRRPLERRPRLRRRRDRPLRADDPVRRRRAGRTPPRPPGPPSTSGCSPPRSR